MNKEFQNEKYLKSSDINRWQLSKIDYWKGSEMWYFAWILGLPLAAAFAVLNAMWFELMDDEAVRQKLQGKAGN